MRARTHCESGDHACATAPHSPDHGAAAGGGACWFGMWAQPINPQLLQRTRGPQARVLVSSHQASILGTYFPTAKWSYVAISKQDVASVALAEEVYAELVSQRFARA